MEHKEEQEKESWNAFLHTGKVEDYLRYASCKVEGNATESVGDRPYAGFYSSNRNYSETESYRGI